MSEIWNTIFVAPIINLLVYLYLLVGNLGWAIIALSLILKTILIPFALPMVKTVKKQRDIQPQLDELKKKYGHDKAVMAQKQMELFKQHGINPGFGCLTQVVVLLVLISLWRAVTVLAVDGDISKVNSLLYSESIKFQQEQTVNTSFLYLDLSKPDKLLILAFLSAALQYVSAKMTMPIMKKAEVAAKNTEQKSDDMALMIQQQSMIMMPLMSFFVGLSLPSGVMIYIVTTTLYAIVQTYFVSGWGGMAPLIDKINTALKRKSYGH